jgi:hypothetical protein
MFEVLNAWMFVPVDSNPNSRKRNKFIFSDVV